MPTPTEITAALRTVDDPEMPISIVDLGIVESIEIEPAHDDKSHADQNGDRQGTVIHIDITPTFVGCPALDMIRDLVRKKLVAMDGVDEVNVNFVNDPPWSVDRISDAGRARLQEHGVTVPERGDGCLSGGHLHLAGDDSATAIASTPVRLQTSAIRCPFCDSASTHLDSPFGPTRCRAIYYCEACKNSFEHMRRV